MSYTVLARKYRPQTFADLVGQEHVTRTLANAINTGRVAHAFLFTGVRGVGKTTSARILAKALNCERGPTPEPCNVCDICKQITVGVDLDVLEIDGASNNGVDDVRRLQESLPYRPTRDRFKIVIVDEVHMLSTGAFNAFLKTLEEPPAHVKFIFATTESHKVPVTIRSRCQRYDFRLIPQTVIASRVRQILASENIEADTQAVAIVAREAAGSMRDAVTLLDQVIAFSGELLVGNEVAERLGIADRDQLFRLAESVLASDPKSALMQIDAIALRGLDLAHFTRQWLELLRDMVVLRVADDKPELVELPEDERNRALEIARAQPLLELERVFAGVAKLVDEVGKASAPRLLLEMGALRLATRPPLQDLSELIARLSRLDSGGGNSAPTQAGRPPVPTRPEPSGRSAPESSAARPQTQERPSSAVAPRDVRSDQSAGKPNPFQRFVPPESSASASKPTLVSGATAPQFGGPNVLSHGQAAVAQAVPQPAAMPQASSARVAVSPVAPFPETASEVRSVPDHQPPTLALSATRVASGHTGSSPHASAAQVGGPSPTPTAHTASASSMGAANASSPSASSAGHASGPLSASTVQSPSAPSTNAVQSPSAPSTNAVQSPGSRQATSSPGPVDSARAPLRPGASPAHEAPPAASFSAPVGVPTAGRPPSAQWVAIVTGLRTREPRWSAMFEHGVPLELTAERVTVVFQEGSFFGRQAQTQGGLEALKRAAQHAFGREPAIEVRFAVDLPGRTIAQCEAAQLDERKEGIKRKALSHPRVIEALKVFPELGQKHDVQVD